MGRLMEKLQLASHAIGDIEALLEASGMGEQEENGADGFEEMIRKLVIASLAGKDMEAATKKAEKSITEAKVELEREEKNIDAMLGGMDNAAGEFPFPRLPEAIHSMEVHQFIPAALNALGASEKERSPDLYQPGSSRFGRLVSRITGNGLHRVDDGDVDIITQTEVVAKEWGKSFGANYAHSRIRDAQRSFTGTTLVRVRVTVTHDSYERLIEIPFSLDGHWSKADSHGMNRLPDILENLESIGIDASYVSEKAKSDEGISEFCRFYNARLNART